MVLDVVLNGGGCAAEMVTVVVSVDVANDDKTHLLLGTTSRTDGLLMFFEGNAPNASTLSHS